MYDNVWCYGIFLYAARQIGMVDESPIREASRVRSFGNNVAFRYRQFVNILCMRCDIAIKPMERPFRLSSDDPGTLPISITEKDHISRLSRLELFFE